MSIKVKAIERKLKFEAGENGAFQYRYVLQPELYTRLSESKLIEEAHLRSGINTGALTAAWNAIGQVITAWVTEGHTVTIPGLGTMRFGLRSTAVDDVNKVASCLITSRRVIFTPSVEIKEKFKETGVIITCYDRNGEIVKHVNSADSGDVEDPDQENQNGDESQNGGANQNGGDNPSGGDNGQDQ